MNANELLSSAIAKLHMDRARMARKDGPGSHASTYFSASSGMLSSVVMLAALADPSMTVAEFGRVLRTLEKLGIAAISPES